MPKENWLLSKLNEGIDHTTEANTSRYVHEVIVHCFGWPFESIIPQASKRGFIDYQLNHEQGTQIHVEVKPFTARLQEEMILKYLSSRSNAFSIGILTNLREWQIFAAGRPVKRLTGYSAHRVHHVEIKKRSHVNELAELIGYRNCANSVKLFERFSQNEDVLRHLLSRDEFIIKAIRNRLKDVAPIDRMPNHSTIAKHMRRLVKNYKHLELDALLARHLKDAAHSRLVAEATRQQLRRLCGASVGQRRVQTLIRRIILSR